MSFKTVIEQLPRIETEWVRPLDPGSYRLASFLLMRLFGLIYTLAFLSLSNQLGPLIGSDGLLPASLYLEKVARSVEGSTSAWALMPTIFWLMPRMRPCRHSATLDSCSPYSCSAV